MKLKEFKEMVKNCLNMWEISLANDVAKKVEDDTYAKRLMQKCNKVSEKYLLNIHDSFVYLFRYSKIR